MNVVESVVAASAAPDQALTWMLEVGADGVTLDWHTPSEAVTQAGVHLDFGTLDAKLAL